MIDPPNTNNAMYRDSLTLPSWQVPENNEALCFRGSKEAIAATRATVFFLINIHSHLNALREKCPKIEFFLVHIQFKCGKIRTGKKSVFGHFSSSANLASSPLV